MAEPEFRYSPLVVGAYRGLLFIPLIFLMTGQLTHGLLLLGAIIAAGFLFRPFVVRTGLYAWYCDRYEGNRGRINRERGDKRAAEIERKLRDDRLRRSREKDPSLPKNW